MKKHRNNHNPHIKRHKAAALHGHCILPYLGKRQDLTPSRHDTFATPSREGGDWARDGKPGAADGEINDRHAA